MILLDSDHLTVLKYRESERYARLTTRLQAVADEAVGTPIVNVEEQMRGWLASLAKERYCKTADPTIFILRKSKPAPIWVPSTGDQLRMTGKPKP